MNTTAVPNEEMEDAGRELIQLQRQAEAARAVLAQLHRDMTQARNILEDGRTARLQQANEQLVLAALRAQSDAATAERTLKDVARSVGHDALTELPNRVLLLDRFAHAIAFAKRHNARLALLFLDLNKFKEINDTLGHAVGDEVLKVAAQRLATAVRAADTVSRHGGDEFLILLAEVAQSSDAGIIANKVIAALGAPSRIGDHVIRLTASIGISVYPDDGVDAQTLIDRADAAMYRAKRHGLGGFAFSGMQPTGEPHTEPRALASLQRPATRYEIALTEHERRHAELQEANEQLVLAALDARQLQAAAEQAQRRQMEFLGILAHELRSPLAPISTAATLLSRIPQEGLPQVQALIERQVAHISHLVGDLLDVSRVSTGKLRLEQRMVDMTGVIDEAVEACRAAMDMRLQRFAVQTPSHSLELRGDPVRLTQIVRNLLDNASKYTPPGGEIGLSVAIADDALVLTVSDNGIGITAKALPTVFEPFVRDVDAIGFNPGGLGIGLTVVRELAGAHGGSVVATSGGSGLGSRFVVTLPLRGRES